MDTPSRQQRKGLRVAAKGKIHSKHHHQHGGGNVYVQEMCASVQALDAIQGRHSRILLLVDGLETTDGEKVLECVETIHSCFNRQMLINIICTDFHLLSSAANTNFLRPSSNLQLNGNEYLQNTIQLPIFLVDNLKRKRKQLTTDSDYNLQELNLNKKMERIQQFEALRDMSLSCEVLNPKLMKRIMSLLMITARLMRVHEQHFTWQTLFSWLVMCELWPFTTISIYSYHKLTVKECKRKSVNVLQLYNEISTQVPQSNDFDYASSTSLVEFLSNPKFVILASDMEVFYKYSVNIDARLFNHLPSFIHISNNTSCSDTSSEIPTNQKYHTSFAVSDWSVDDVCSKICCLPGLSITNIPKYERFIRINNFHGMALVSCELDELKREMKTTFGDWCLIRKFIVESRGNSLLPPSTSNTVQDSFQTNTEMYGTEINFDSVSESSKDNTIGVDQQRLPSSASQKSDKLPIESSSLVSSSSGKRKESLTTLKDEDRAAYNEAFKDYLRLQQTEKQTTELVESFNERSELLKASDNLSFDDSFNGNI